MKKIHVLAAAMLAVGATTAQAASPFYVDIHAGQSTADLPTYANITLDNEDSTYSLNLGYRINDMFSVEGGYTKLGKPTYATSALSGSTSAYGSTLTLTNAVIQESFDLDGYTLGVAMDFPVSEKIDVTGRVGYISWEVDHVVGLTSGSVTYAGTAYTGSVTLPKVDGTDLYFGIGAGYKIDKAMRAGVNFTRYDIGGVDVDTWTANLRYSF
jgi:hypothetical protein